MNTSGSSCTTGSSKVCSTRRSGSRLGTAGRTVVDGAGHPVGVPAGRAEPGQDVARRQPGEVAEAGEAHPGEQPDQLGIGLADVLQPGDRERGEERRRATRRDDDRTPAGTASGDSGGEAAVGDAHPDVRGGLAADGGDDLFGQPLVATEVARRAASAEAQPPRLDHLEAGGEPADGAHDGLERPGVPVGVVVEQHDVGATLLRLAPALADHHPVGCGRRRPGDDPVGVQHHGRHIRRHAGGDDRPVGAPHRDHPPITHGHLELRASAPASERHTAACRERHDGPSERLDVATVPSGPGSHNSVCRGRGTRRPVDDTVTRLPRR